ncbi:uncoordinated protein 73 [Aphelenchoides avenae]|nr:uncoordinated protein 73 [Aphelenchus avenae]
MTERSKRIWLNYGGLASLPWAFLHVLLQGKLQLAEAAPGQTKDKDLKLAGIFLFEQSAIIADCIMPKTEYGNPTYIFRKQILVNRMAMEENVPDQPLSFILKSTDASQPVTFLLRAKTQDEKRQWVEKIVSLLDQQNAFVDALVDPKRAYENQMSSSIKSLNV